MPSLALRMGPDTQSMSEAMIGKRICREAVTGQRREGRIRLQHGAGTEPVGAEHESIAHRGALCVALSLIHI